MIRRTYVKFVYMYVCHASDCKCKQMLRGLYVIRQNSYITTATTIMFDFKHDCGHVSSDSKPTITSRSMTTKVLYWADGICNPIPGTL